MFFKNAGSQPQSGKMFIDLKSIYDFPHEPENDWEL